MGRWLWIALLVAACSAPPPGPGASIPPDGRAATGPAGRAIAFRSTEPPPSVGRASAPAPAVLVASTPEELARLTERRTATWLDAAALPAFDPATDVLVAVFAGERPSGGYAARVTAVRTVGDTIRLTVTETVPPPGSVQITLVTHPYDVVALARADLPLPVGQRLAAVTPDGRESAQLAYCGTWVQRSPAEPYDRGGHQCVRDAYAAGRTAQYALTLLTTEGAPIRYTVRAVPQGLSEITSDTSADPFAAGGRLRAWACRQLAVVPYASVPDRFGFAFTECTGDGARVDLP